MCGNRRGCCNCSFSYNVYNIEGCLTSENNSNSCVEFKTKKNHGEKFLECLWESITRRVVFLKEELLLPVDKSMLV